MKVLAVEADIELAWASKLLGMTTIKRQFLLRSADGGTELTQAGTYRGLGGSRGPGGARGALKTIANLRGSYMAINEAIKKQAEARQQRFLRAEPPRPYLRESRSGWRLTRSRTTFTR